MKLTFKQRIWAIPGIAALLFGIGIAVNISTSSNTLGHIDRAGSVDYPALNKINGFIAEVRGISSDMQQAVAEGEKDGLKSIQEREQRIRKTIAFLATLPGHGEFVTRITQEFDAYYQPTLKAGKMMLGIETGSPQVEVQKMQAGLKTLSADLEQQYERENQQLTQTLVDSSDNVKVLMKLNILVALVAIAGLIITSYFIIRLVWRQLGGEPEYAIQIAQTIAAGDFRTEIDTIPGDRTSLLVTLRDMQSNLAATIVRIKDSGETIGQAAQLIFSGNSDLSERTSLQARSLEQTTTSIEALTSTVKKNVDNAELANRLAESASDVAVKGGSVVSQVVDTMGSINASSKKISDIIGVIDGIAFQTNILALNAAVEAARAGEQGRGFAVVATEVRSLAQRCAEAAKEIKVLIGSSVAQIDAGAELANLAGTTMEDIVTSIKRVTDIMSEINDASREQSSGIEQVNNAISNMEQTTRQNAQMVDEATSAAHSLNEQAEELAQVVGVFTLGSTPATSPSRPTAAAAAGPVSSHQRLTLAA